MSPESRKQTIQVVVLIILLVGLGFSMWRMLRTVQSSSVPAKPATQAEPLAVTPSDKLSIAQATGQSKTGTEEGGVPVAVPERIEMNPNLFRVYKLSPAKNPFKQEESWYEDELKQIPGYPELRDSKFLETMTPTVPDMTELLGEDESWQEVKLTKTQQDKQYSVSGSSDDESISTQVTYTGPTGRKVEVDWRPGSGVPLSALNDPTVAQNFAIQGGQVPAAMPPDEDLFMPPGEGGELKIPGIDELITGGVVPGDQIYCHGISVQNGHAYALVSFNGTTRLVQEGDSLPPRYTVQAITGDGAVLFNLRTEETQWLPVRAPVPHDTTGGASGTAGGGTATGSTYMPQPMFPVVGGRT